MRFKLVLTRNKNETVLDKTPGITDIRIKIDHIHWYVPHFTHSIQQPGVLSKQFLIKTPTELRYVDRSVFMKEVNNQNLWNFELGSQESMSVAIWIIVGFQQRHRQDSQDLSNDSFCRLLVIIARCIIGTKKHPDSGILYTYDDDDDSQAYAQIKEVLRVLTKDNVLQPYIADDDFRSAITGFNEIEYNIKIFDIRYQQNFTACQPNKIKFKVNGVVPNDINGYALVLTNKLVSLGSDAQKHFDLF